MYSVFSLFKSQYEMKWNEEYYKSIHIITCIALNNNTPNNCDISYRITIQSTKLVTCFHKSFIGEIDKTGVGNSLYWGFFGRPHEN